MPQQVSNEVKQQIISEYIKTAAGRAKLAASMIQPLRLRRDYTAVGRKTFLVEQLPDGALPIYDKDPEVTAFVVGEEGSNILAIQKPRRVIFPLFEIASNPEIPLTRSRSVVSTSLNAARTSPRRRFRPLKMSACSPSSTASLSRASTPSPARPTRISPWW